MDLILEDLTLSVASSSLDHFLDDVTVGGGVSTALDLCTVRFEPFGRCWRTLVLTLNTIGGHSEMTRVIPTSGTGEEVAPSGSCFSSKELSGEMFED